MLLVLSGMGLVFRTNFARQRTYSALPEVSRLAREQNMQVTAFSPDEASRCRLESFEINRTSGLDPIERNACRAAGYAPASELVQIRFSAHTTCRSATLPGLPDTVEIRTAYQATRLVRR